jgi:hypothetical protein
MTNPVSLYDGHQQATCKIKWSLRVIDDTCTAVTLQVQIDAQEYTAVCPSVTRLSYGCIIPWWQNALEMVAVDNNTWYILYMYYKPYKYEWPPGNNIAVRHSVTRLSYGCIIPWWQNALEMVTVGMIDQWYDRWYMFMYYKPYKYKSPPGNNTAVRSSVTRLSYGCIIAGWQNVLEMVTVGNRWYKYYKPYKCEWSPRNNTAVCPVSRLS